MNQLSTSSQKPMLIGVLSILTLLFLFTAFGFSVLLTISTLTKISATGLFASRIFFWFSLLLLFIYSIKIEKQPLLLWNEKRYNAIFYLLSLLGIFFTLFILMATLNVTLKLFKLNSISAKISQMLAIMRGNKLLVIFTCLTAGVTEELIFRGYLQPRFQLLLKNQYLAIGLNAILFGLMHYRYGTVVNVLGPVLIGLVFSLHYQKFNNIKVLILFHFLWDWMILSVQMYIHK